MFTQIIEQPLLTRITSPIMTQHQLSMHQARIALEVAENRLNLAEDDDSRDAASHEVTAARIRLNAVFKRAKAGVA